MSAIPHTCHARDCNKEVPRAMFMCKRHWFMVPSALRRLIWKHYQHGQEEGLVRPTDEYLTHTRRAIEVVWQLEQLPTSRKRKPHIKASSV